MSMGSLATEERFSGLLLYELDSTLDLLGIPVFYAPLPLMSLLLKTLRLFS